MSFSDHAGTTVQTFQMSLIRHDTRPFGDYVTLSELTLSTE